MQCPSPVEIWPNSERKLVPCGKCIPCLSNKRNDWIIRLRQEHKASQGASFITLTYDWKNYPKDGKLCKLDLQLFMKRLRKKSGSRLRYFAVGEYGSKNGRPHYHLLLFNVTDINHRKLNEAWGKGIVHVGQVTEASIAYCTKYVIQPKHADQFTLMSRGYGIGLNYLTDAMVGWHREDDRNYLVEYGVKRRLPRYYKDKIWYKTEDKWRVGLKAQSKGISAYLKEIKYWKKRGIKDPIAHIKEMRNAVISRVQKKVAFSQTF